MAKKAPPQPEPITLAEIAEELNDVMQYGVNPENGEVERPEEQIDPTQKEKALLADIIKNAKADLRPDDENSFSEDAWNWFIDQGITPGADSDEIEDGDEGEEEEPPAPKKGGKKEAKAPPAKKEEKASSKAGIAPKKAMIPGGNEKKAIELATEGCTLEDFIDEFTAIYKASGNNDKEYAARRAKVYYNLGYKKINKVPPDAEGDAPAPKKPETKTKAKAAPAKEAPAPRGRGRKADPEPEPEEEPEKKPRGRGRR